MTMRDKKTPSLTSLEKALRIYDAFAQSENALGVSEISRNLNIKKAAVHRVLITLERSGYLEKDVSNNKYCIGPKILIFAERFRDSSIIRTIAIPFMEKLASETGETIGLHVAMGNIRCCIKDFESKHVLRSSLREGYTAPIYLGSVGRVLLSGMGKEELRELFNSEDFRMHAPKLLKDFQSLNKELDQTLAKGYAISCGEKAAGVWSLSSPVFNNRNEVVAALSISIPEARIDSELVERYAVLVKNTARGISSSLGYHD